MNPRDQRVLLVPGLGLAGAELIPLALRLRRKGYPVSVFWHWTGKRSLDDSATRLWRFATRQKEETIHFVGHSLGGIVALRMLADHPWDRPGRIVTLGTPHTGLRAARRLAAIPGGGRLLWPGVRAASNGPPVSIPAGRELGVLAGDRSALIGSWIVPGEPSDCVIAVAETEHPGSHARLTLRTTHYGMLLTAAVAARIDTYLREGKF